MNILLNKSSICMRYKYIHHKKVSHFTVNIFGITVKEKINYQKIILIIWSNYKCIVTVLFNDEDYLFYYNVVVLLLARSKYSLI